MDGVRYVIVFDELFHDGHKNEQIAFFGFDAGVPVVVKDFAKIFSSLPDALEKLPLATKKGAEFPELSKPYVVEIPN